MGTGSFGGGSGGFGGGGSGSIGGVSVTGKKSDSLLDRVLALIGLTNSINDNPAIAVARKTIAEALQTPVRRRYLQEILSDPFVDGIFRALFEISQTLGTPADPSRLGPGLGLQQSTFTLAAVVAALVNRHKSREVDERYMEITRCALADLFLEAVDNDYRAYAQQPAGSIAKFNRRPFQSLCGHFLSSIIREIVRRDVLGLSQQAQASVQQATREIANRWFDIFESKYYDGKSVRYRDMLQVIAQNYPMFSRSE
jgi:hypothetical protein